MRFCHASSCHSGRSGMRLSADFDGLAQLVGMQSLGQRIDRIDQRQLGEARGVDDAVGMQHLQVAVVERRNAGDVTQLALGQELLQIIFARVEIGDGQRVGVIARLDIVGRARAIGRRRPMPVDGDGESDDRVGLDVGQLRLIAPVDETARHVKQQIDDARRLAFAPDEAAEYLLKLRADARQGGQWRKQRIEHRRTHRTPADNRAVALYIRLARPVRAFGVELFTGFAP